MPPTYPYLTLRPGTSAAAGALIGHCRARLAAYKVPRSVDFRDALPTSAAGKTLKSRLRAEHASSDAIQEAPG